MQKECHEQGKRCLEQGKKEHNKCIGSCLERGKDGEGRCLERSTSAQVHKIVALVRVAMVLVQLDQNMFLFWVILKEQGVHLS